MSQPQDPVSRLGNRLVDQMADVVVQVFLSLLVSLVRPMATVTEVFFRKQMGERYFSVLNIMAGVPLILLFGIPVWALFDSSWGFGAWLNLLLSLAWTGAFNFYAFKSLQAVKVRYQEGVRWHSYNYGIPRYPALHPALERIIPLGVTLLLILCGAYGLAVLLVLSTYLSYMGRVIAANRFFARVLDAIDQQIEADNLSKAVLERLQPEQAEGLMTPMPAYVSTMHREKFVQAVTGKAPSRDMAPTPVPAIQRTLAGKTIAIADRQARVVQW
jgi:hypothetical protein